MNWPAYPGYKNSGMEELGEIPAEWDATRLRRLVQVNPTVPAQIRRDPESIVPFVPMEAIGEDWSLDSSQSRAVGDVLAGYSYFADGDVLFAKVTPCFENGKGSLVNDLPSGRGFGTTEITVVRPQEGLDQAFLGYFLRSDQFRQSSIGAMTGAGGLKRVPDEHLRKTALGYPSLDEQRTIARFLDRETGKIDALIDKQHQLIATLREDRTATITHAVTKGLNPDTEMKASGVEWIGDVPADWSVVEIKLNHEVKLGKMLKAEPTSPLDVLQPYLRAAHVPPTGFTTRDAKEMWFSPRERADLTLRKGDVVVVEGGMGGYGRCDIVTEDLPGWGFQNSINRVRRLDGSSGAFTKYSLQMAREWGFIDVLCSVSTMPHLTAEKLGEMRIPNPSASERAEITAYLDRATTKIDELIMKTEESTSRLQEYRSALITATVTGKIDVREEV